jgi:hypothetical protein
MHACNAAMIAFTALQFMNKLDDSSRLQFDEFHTGFLRNSFAEDSSYDDQVRKAYGSMVGGLTLDLMDPGLSTTYWTEYMGSFVRTWNLQQNYWSEAMLFAHANDADNVADSLTLVASRRLTESQAWIALDSWLNKTRRSTIEYLKLSCLQQSTRHEL